MKQDNYDHAHDRQQAPGMSTGHWIIALFAMVIPLVSIIILIIWGFQIKPKSSGNSET